MTSSLGTELAGGLVRSGANILPDANTLPSVGEVGDDLGGVDGAELVVVAGDLDLTLRSGDSRRGDLGGSGGDDVWTGVGEYRGVGGRGDDLHLFLGAGGDGARTGDGDLCGVGGCGDLLHLLLGVGVLSGDLLRLWTGDLDRLGLLAGVCLVAKELSLEMDFVSSFSRLLILFLASEILASWFLTLSIRSILSFSLSRSSARECSRSSALLLFLLGSEGMLVLDRHSLNRILEQWSR